MRDEDLRSVLRFALGDDADDPDCLARAGAAMTPADEPRLPTLALTCALNAPKVAAGELARVDPHPTNPDRPSVLRALAAKLAAASWGAERVASFLAFSQQLTGFDRLDERVARAHLGRASVSDVGCGGALVALLDRWDAAAPGKAVDLPAVVGELGRCRRRRRRGRCSPTASTCPTTTPPSPCRR